PLHSPLHICLDLVKDCPSAVGHIVKLYPLYFLSHKGNISVGIDKPIIPVGAVPISFCQYAVFSLFALPFYVINSSNYHVGVFDKPLSVREQSEVGIVLIV